MLPPVPPEIPGGVMGARLVKRVATHWPGLNSAPWRVLATMAVTALDDPDPQRGLEAALYFRGHEYLARALGLAFPDGDDPKAAAARKGSLRNVRRYIDVLIEVKAVAVVDGSRKVAPGISQTYRLLVEDGSHFADST